MSQGPFSVAKTAALILPLVAGRILLETFGLQTLSLLTRLVEWGLAAMAEADKRSAPLKKGVL
jgi:hypothetical protein